MIKQLQNPEFRFCLIRKQTKKPFEKEWQKRGYKFNDPKLLKHLKNGGNYGVIGGYGNLRILDIDDKTKVGQFKKEFKNTFLVETGGGGLHIYFISDYNTNYVLKDNIGEFRANNYQVVGVGSLHPNGKKYKAINDNSIINLPQEMVGSLLKPYLRDEPDAITTKDASGSGLEYRRVLAMIRAGKTRNVIYKELGNYRKWATSPQQYRDMTYNKAMDYHLKKQEEVEVKEKPKIEKIDLETFKRHLKEIYKQTIEILKYYMDVEEDDYILVATWIIGTYFHNEFSTYPYLFFNAMKGSGKSRILKLIKTLSKDGRMLNSLTEAVLFRTKGTLCIDEFEGIGKKGNENLRELLNSAYKKGIKVIRFKKVSSKKGEEQAEEEFEVYRPVVIANIWGMEEVLSDRCIQLILEKSNKPEITKIIENFEQHVQIMDMLRLISLVNGHVGQVKPLLEKTQKGWNEFIKANSTHMSNLSNVSNTSNTSNMSTTIINNKINKTGLFGRDLELYLPLFIVADFCGVLDKMLKISVKKTKEKKEKDIYESRDVQLYDFVSKSENTDYIKVRDLTIKFKEFLGSEEKDKWPSTWWLGLALKRLNLIKERKRSNGTLVILDIEKAKEKIKMFKVPEETQEKLDDEKIKVQKIG